MDHSPQAVGGRCSAGAVPERWEMPSRGMALTLRRVKNWSAAAWETAGRSFDPSATTAPAVVSTESVDTRAGHQRTLPQPQRSRPTEAPPGGLQLGVAQFPCWSMFASLNNCTSHQNWFPSTSARQAVEGLRSRCEKKLSSHLLRGCSR